ncbi:unnamed protein product [Haemonchus placei]|uniref:PDZ domain-containing protein n=1 Tax=Haemonchus placei TaxID=6290 RepID=A0A0N4WLL7_HAEPC|nr:unnamed protein product [Haemonchus placei]
MSIMIMIYVCSSRELNNQVAANWGCCLGIQHQVRHSAPGGDVDASIIPTLTQASTIGQYPEDRLVLILNRLKH